MVLQGNDCVCMAGYGYDRALQVLRFWKWFEVVNLIFALLSLCTTGLQPMPTRAVQVGDGR